MTNERLEEIIAICQKYQINRMYLDGEKPDIFYLFGFSKNISLAEMQSQEKRLRILFHEDLLHHIPDEYKTTFKQIGENIIKHLNFKKYPETWEPYRDGIIQYQEQKKKAKNSPRSHFSAPAGFSDRKTPPASENRGSDYFHQARDFNTTNAPETTEQFIYRIIRKYNQIMFNNPKILNYYELFDLNGTLSAAALKQSPQMKKLFFAFTIGNCSYAKTEQDSKTFLKICELLDDFYKWTLSTEMRKTNYDSQLLASLKKEQKRTTKTSPEREIKPYKYREYNKNLKMPKNKELLDMQERYFTFVQQCLLEYGATIGINIVYDYLNTKAINPVYSKVMPYCNGLDCEQIIFLLKKSFDKKCSLYHLVELSMDYLLTKKSKILQIATLRTAKRHGENGALTALMNAYSKGNYGYFSNPHEKGDTLTREQLIREIPPRMIKFVLGTTFNEEYGYILEDYQNRYNIVNAKTLSDYVRRVTFNMASPAWTM